MCEFFAKSTSIPNRGCFAEEDYKRIPYQERKEKAMHVDLQQRGRGYLIAQSIHSDAICRTLGNGMATISETQDGISR